MKNKISYILRKEIKEMFRDKKSLMMMLVVPIMIPLLIIGMSALFEMQMNRPVTDYNRIGFAYDLGEIEESLAKEFELNFVTGKEEEIKKQYQDGFLDLYITKENSIYTIHGDDNDTTSLASSLVESYFNAYKEHLQEEYLKEHEIESQEVIQMIQLKEDIKETENYFSNYITNYAFLFILMAITVSATYPSTDTTAGEKERGTLETLLTFPIKSKDIIIGKFLSVSFSSVITGIISLVLMVISLMIAGNMFEIYKGVEMMLPLNSLIFSTVVIIAYSLLISGLCIAVASKSKTFKEAQSALTPLTFISFFPGMIAFMVDLESSSFLSLVPFLNYSLLFTDITNGTINYLNIFLMLISTVVVIGLVLGIIIKQYKSEKVLFQ